MSYFDKHIKLTEYQNLGYEIVPGLIVRAFVGYIRIIKIDFDRGLVTEYIDEWGWHVTEKKKYVSKVLLDECFIVHPDKRVDTFDGVMLRCLFKYQGTVYMKDDNNMTYLHPFLNNDELPKESTIPQYEEFDPHNLIEFV